MGGSEADASAKIPKASAPQDQPPATSSTPAAPVYPEWPSFQAYSPIPPHGFFPSPVASSPQPHPYMWGPQFVPPYGTPPPPYVMYPPGGLYAHPSMPPGSNPFSPYSMSTPNGNAEASGAVPSGVEMDGKSSEGKERSPLKRSKGSLGSLNMITGKNNNDPCKTSGQQANGVFSQSGESGSDSSSEGSDANSQNDSQPKTSGGHEFFDENSKSGNTTRGSQNGVNQTPSQVMLNQTMAFMPIPTGAPGGVAGPTTNLNIGMDYWGTSNSSPIPAMRGKIPATAVGGNVVPGAPSELWLQDERELKRQRRKQSNRESARRSRLRKQAECEELAQRAEVLNEENASLTAELNRVKSVYEQLLSQNTLLKEKLGEAQQGTGDSSIEKNELLSGDDNLKKKFDSDAQAKESDPVQSGL